MDAKRDLKLSKALFTSLGSLSRGLKIGPIIPAGQFQKTSTKRGSIFPEIFMASACFPMQCFPVFHSGNIVSTVSFSKMEICLCFMAGNFSENPSMRAVAKLFRARASKHSSCHFFASNSCKRQILRALSNRMRPFDTPLSPC